MYDKKLCRPIHIPFGSAFLVDIHLVLLTRTKEIAAAAAGTSYDESMKQPFEQTDGY